MCERRYGNSISRTEESPYEINSEKITNCRFPAWQSGIFLLR
ncbi:hypothetical protein AcetOrient_orf02057 [Acetobacter orientalis]|uniref:Uncharacterized protein n=1 Tax=Acetobacter orientalis TaxID=146474 RepID=A0A2Z5ZGL9_9PROT|nr:hypothetical protein AcetOrient_orf02057 [Acetobacter orientalis]